MPAGSQSSTGSLKDSFFIGPIVATFLFQDLLQGNKVRTLDREFFLEELVNHFMAGIDGSGQMKSTEKNIG
jgi:hypothetical protein